MGLFDRLRKKQKIEDAAEHDAHFSSRSKNDDDTAVEQDTSNAKNTEKQATGKKKKAAPKQPTTVMKGSVLLRPIITEKSTLDGSYVFAVTMNANKSEIAKAIEQSYGVKPTSVRVMRVMGKKVRWGGVAGERKDWKKAIITLPKGKTINVYDA